MRLRNVPGSREAIADNDMAINVYLLEQSKDVKRLKYLTLDL